MKYLLSIWVLLVVAAHALTISAPGLRPGCSYELYMVQGLGNTNWVDLCEVTGTNAVIVSPDGQPPTFFRAQFSSPMRQGLSWSVDITPNTSGYNVYCGSASRTYTEMCNAGTNTVWVFASNNPAPVNYYAVTAYENYGGNYLESDFSNEVAVTNQLTLVIQ